MSAFLDFLKKSSQSLARPPRIVIYGTAKVGKTTFAADAPEAVFIPTEDGLSAVSGVTSFPLCKSYSEVIQAVNGLLTEEHAFKTVVIDSIDWLESMLQMHVSHANGKASIEDFGYGKGFAFATDEMVNFLNLIDRLRIERGMMIILIAHHDSKTFTDPLTESYHRYSLKLHKGALEKVQEWADLIMFANHDQPIKTANGQRNQKPSASGVATNRDKVSPRRLYYFETPAFIAGSRFKMPLSTELSFNAFKEAFEENNDRPLI